MAIPDLQAPTNTWPNTKEILLWKEEIFQNKGSSMTYLILFLSQVKSSITFKLRRTILNKQKNLQKTVILQNNVSVLGPFKKRQLPYINTLL